MASTGALEIHGTALVDRVGEARADDLPTVIDLRGEVREFPLEEFRLTPAMQTARFDLPAGAYLTVVKPVLDRLVALVLLVVLCPLILAVAAAVRIKMGEGVFFRQTRIGYLGRPFTIVKFRTMGHCRRTNEVPVAVDRRQTHKSPDDPRLTPLGTFLRKWSLDELPQLLNILRGEMSFVGPRPELDSVVEHYEVWQHRRHVVRPGLTGLWQVSARADGPLMCECTEVDLEYVDDFSALTDLKIVIKTPMAALGSNRGA